MSNDLPLIWHPLYYNPKPSHEQFSNWREYEMRISQMNITPEPMLETNFFCTSATAACKSQNNIPDEARCVPKPDMESD